MTTCPSNSRTLPDVEAVVGIRGVLGPFEQSPLKLHGDLGDGVGRKLDKHLQQVGPQTVLRWLVVDVAWHRKRKVELVVFIHNHL